MGINPRPIMNDVERQIGDHMAKKLDMEDKAALSIAGGFILIWLFAVIGVAFVVFHFVSKFW
jgi:hypothetical protein